MLTITRVKSSAGLKNNSTFSFIYRVFHNSRPREKEETRDCCWMCNFEEKKIQLKTYSRKDNLKLTNQISTPPRCVCRNFTLLGLHLRKSIFKIFGRLELFLKDVTVKLNL
jgi:hypothetical protein